MRVVFMGTPDVAVPSLVALHEAFDVVAVYTRPDKPRGRGLQTGASPVKQAAIECGIDVRQPARLRGEAETLAAMEPDVIAVVAYGAILRPDVLEVPKLGCVNVHFSLLPRWRGAAPVERAILAGDERTGVTTMLMDEGLDTGPMLLQEVVEIGPDDTAGALRARLADLGASLLVETLRRLEDGTLEPRSQPDDGATYAEKVDAAEAELDPGEPAVVLERKVRAFLPSPGAFLIFRGKRLKVRRAAVEEGGGEVGAVSDGLVLQTSEARLRLVEVQPEGKKPMLGEEFARGQRLRPDDRVHSPRD